MVQRTSPNPSQVHCPVVLCILNHEKYFYASLLTNARSYSYMYIQRRSQLCLKNCEVDLVISVRCWVVLMYVH